MWNLKYATNETIYKTETDSWRDIENRLVVAKGEGDGGRMEGEVRVSRYKLLYIEWITTSSYCIVQGTIFSILL